jgi:hypothetical protein
MRHWPGLTWVNAMGLNSKNMTKKGYVVPCTVGMG